MVLDPIGLMLWSAATLVVFFVLFLGAAMAITVRHWIADDKRPFQE